MNDMVANIAPAGMILFAAWATWEARKAAIATSAAVNAQAVYAAMSEYFQPTMANAIRTLWTWSNKHKSHFPTAWVQEFKEKTPEACAVDEAKQHVKGYFLKAARLYSAKLITEDGLRAIAFVHGLNTFLDVVMALDEAQNPNVERDTEEVLLAVLGRYPSPPPRV